MIPENSCSQLADQRLNEYYIYMYREREKEI